MPSTIPCPKCDRPYRCPKCNGDRLFTIGTLYDKTRYRCSDCKMGSYHCRECAKQAQKEKDDKLAQKQAQPSKRSRQWGWHGY